LPDWSVKDRHAKHNTLSTGKNPHICRPKKLQRVCCEGPDQMATFAEGVRDQLELQCWDTAGLLSMKVRGPGGRPRRRGHGMGGRRLGEFAPFSFPAPPTISPAFFASLPHGCLLGCGVVSAAAWHEWVGQKKKKSDAFFWKWIWCISLFVFYYLPQGKYHKSNCFIHTSFLSNFFFFENSFRTFDVTTHKESFELWILKAVPVRLNNCATVCTVCSLPSLVQIVLASC